MENSFARTCEQSGIISWLLLLVWTLDIWYNMPMERQDSIADIIVLFIILITGAAEAAHLAGVFLHRPVSGCTVLFGIFTVSAAALLFILTAVRRHRGFCRREAGEGRARFSRKEMLLPVLFGLLAVSQIIYILCGKNAYLQGDMTVETVQSFLETDTVYGVNPMTGRAYEGGIPTRIEILCLPTLYAVLSRIFHIRPERLILQGIPVMVLIGCYGAYACLAKGLFPGNRRKQFCFLIVTAFLIWIGSGSFGADGFGLLLSGWRGVTIRNGILVPYAVSLCLRKKFIYLPLCILAELCIVWTLYGMGVCLAVVLGMMLVSLFTGKGRAGKEAADGGTP